MAREIKAFGKIKRIPKALSNYMAGCTEGRERAKQAFIDTINSQPMDPAVICKALNNHRWTTMTFKPDRPIENGISIAAVDKLGNTDIILIKE